MTIVLANYRVLGSSSFLVLILQFLQVIIINKLKMRLHGGHFIPQQMRNHWKILRVLMKLVVNCFKVLICDEWISSFIVLYPALCCTMTLLYQGWSLRFEECIFTLSLFPILMTEQCCTGTSTIRPGKQCGELASRWNRTKCSYTTVLAEVCKTYCYTNVRIWIAYISHLKFPTEPSGKHTATPMSAFGSHTFLISSRHLS